MSRSSYQPPQPKSVTIVGVILILLGTAGVIYFNQSLQRPLQNTSATDTSNSVSQSSLKSEIEVQKTSCKVLNVYDGDTLACDLNKNNRVDKPEEEIRLLGIDTPEMHYSKKNKSHHTSHEQDEPFAKEASQLLTEKADKQMVYLTFDENRSDKYGRTLAYVSFSPKNEASLCELMLSQGLAKTLFIPPNFRHIDHFRSLETEAKEKHLGIWSVNSD